MFPSPASGPADTIASDALRLAELLGGAAPDDPWRHKAVEGISRFLRRVQQLTVACAGSPGAGKAARRVLHETIRDLTGTAAPDPLTAFNRLMVCAHGLFASEERPAANIAAFLQCLHPFAPGVAAETHARLREFHPDIPPPGARPAFDPAALVIDEIGIDLRVNNGLVDRITVSTDAEAAELEAAAMASATVAAAIGTATVVKIVIVPGRLVNVVTDRR